MESYDSSLVRQLRQIVYSHSPVKEAYLEIRDGDLKVALQLPVGYIDSSSDVILHSDRITLHRRRVFFWLKSMEALGNRVIYPQTVERNGWQSQAETFIEKHKNCQHK